MERRVVITGLGTLNPLGNSVPEYWNNLIGGKCGIVKFNDFPMEKYTSKIAGTLKNFDPLLRLDKKEIRRLSKFVIYGLTAAIEAVNDAGMDWNFYSPERVGVITGSGIGGIEEIEKENINMVNNGADRVSPFLIIKMITDILPGKISMRYGLKGSNFSVTTACASSAHAIMSAFWDIKNGLIDAAITGGSEAPLTPLSIAAFCSIQALSTAFNDEPEKASRPFDAKRDGFIIAEGAGMLILEEYEHAKKRGANIYAELLGAGNTADAHHDTAPAPRAEGGRRAMEQAIRIAGIDKEKIGYVNAHGTSTKANDLNETLAIKDLFGDHAKKIPVSSNKSMTGHMLGATAAVEAIASILVMKKGIIPPTINYETPDAEMDLDYVPNKAREQKVDYVISNSFGFGGHNGVLLFGKI